MLVRGALAVTVTLLLVAFGGHGVVRQPTSGERAAITTQVEGVWAYESPTVVPWDPQVRVKRSDAHPVVVSVRVSDSNPVFASAAVELRGPTGRKQAGTAVVVFEKTAGSWTQVSDAMTEFPLACTSATPAGERDLLCPNPWEILDYPQPTAPSQLAYSEPLHTTNLRHVDWTRTPLPGAVCGTAGVIHLHEREAFVHSMTFPWWGVVVVWRSTVSYGDLLGDGHDVAAVHVVCSNNGGTADGQLAFADVVFVAVSGRLRVLGILRPQQPMTPASDHVPVMAPVTITPGKIIGYQSWYGPNDPTSGGSIQATTTWRYAHGQFSVVRTVVQRPPQQ